MQSVNSHPTVFFSASVQAAKAAPPHQASQGFQSGTALPTDSFSVRFAGKDDGPPKLPEDLKPFYKAKLIRNPGFFKSAAILAAGAGIMVGVTILAATLCPPIAPLVALAAGFFISGYAIDKTLPIWEKTDLKMTPEQMERSTKYHNDLLIYKIKKPFIATWNFLTNPFKK